MYKVISTVTIDSLVIHKTNRTGMVWCSYNYVLDQMESQKDQEDMYQEYTWKVSKILGSKLRRTKNGH